VLLILALVPVAACARSARVTYDPAKPSTIAGVLRAHEVTICALDSMADNFVPIGKEGKDRLADAAKNLTAAKDKHPLYPAFPGYYLQVRAPEGGHELYIGFFDEDTLVVRPIQMSSFGDVYTGASELWRALMDMSPVSIEESGELGVLFETTEVTISGRDLTETRITAAGPIAQVVRLLREGQYNSAVDEGQRLPAPPLSLEFEGVDGELSQVLVWQDQFVFGGQLYDRKGIEQSLRGVIDIATR